MRNGGGKKRKLSRNAVSPIPIFPGKEFGQWTVIKFGTKARGYTRWWCLCTCGNKVLVAASSLRRGSWRCLQCAIKTKNLYHGWSGTPTYKAWENMHSRCAKDNKESSNYRKYVGRGISVCRRWSKFTNFLADMGPKPIGKSLDRIDNDSGYKPGNCRWATPVEQANNGRHNIRITHEDKTLTLAQWARFLGITRREAGRFFGVPT